MPAIESLQIQLQQIVGLLEARPYDKTIAAARRLLRRVPDSPRLYLILGMALAGEGKLEPAIHHYRQALRRKPNWFEALNNLGVAYQKQGNLQDAAHNFLAAQKIQPANADVIRNLEAVLPALNGTLFVQNKLPESERVLRTLLGLRPEFPDAAFNLGLTLLKLGQFDESAQFLSQASIRAPEQVRPLAFLAITEHQRGQQYKHFLSRILDMPTPHWRDVGIKMWAAVVLGRPESAFALRTDHLNIVDFDALASFATPQKLHETLAPLPPLAGNRPAANARLLLYAAVDGIYAARYAKPLIASALKHCADCEFHLHIMNPGTFRPEQVFQDMPRERLSWTAEEL